MEVVAATPNGGGVPPFHDHDVREWSRIDSITGALERARLETDHWTANTFNSKHNYNKVVDSRARTDADGAVQQQARRQLEVFQSQVPGGRLQVIKTHTVSSSRWSSKGLNGDSSKFEDLQLSLNPLDLSSEKSKASLRSASRRPPTRQKKPPDNSALFDPHLTAAVNLHRVSRLCHQIHEKAVQAAFGRQSPKLSIDERGSGDGSIEIQEIESDWESSATKSITKSISSEDLSTPDKLSSNKSVEDLEDLEQLQNWRRSSKIRRSLQFPKRKEEKPKILDLPGQVSVRKIREDLEQGRRLNTALRNNNVDLNALDQILQSISSSSSVHSDRVDDEDELISAKKQLKRDSFVSVETLQQVKNRLRRTSSPSGSISTEKEEDEDSKNIAKKEVGGRVRSYVFGMESALKKPGMDSGTGSLESKAKGMNNGIARSEDWYNRRKSYGFEQVETNTQENMNGKSYGDSSTDSGICRSSEIMVVPASTKPNVYIDYSSDISDTDKHYIKPIEFGNVKKMTSIFDNTAKDIKTTIKIPLKDYSEFERNERDLKRHSIAVDESKYHKKPEESKINSVEINQNQRQKKVEFCKTEVHFAADSGKVNIVETDEKPPPTHNFRRRRRDSGPVASDLPILRFGDTNYEKTMFGIDAEYDKNEDLYENTERNSKVGIVTVNSFNGKLNVNNNSNENEIEEERNVENVKGILKNKVTPKPYHLGEELTDDKWGVKLKPVVKEEQPVWRSTVTVHGGVNGEAEFQKLLKSLKPVSSGEEKDTRRSSWAVPEKNEKREEVKGYSTKVNIGVGSAVVVENDRCTTWPREIADSKGREDSASSRTLCSKMTTTQENNTTTTKITIDLSPSPQPKPEGWFEGSNPRSHSFKSTSLILNTLNAKMPQNLAGLRKLYESEQNCDSDADKEIQRLLGSNKEEDRHSVLSNSWSRMRAYKNINEFNSSKARKSDLLNKDPEETRIVKLTRNRFSPIVIRKNKTEISGEKLSSPALVNKNSESLCSSEFRGFSPNKPNSPTFSKPELKTNRGSPGRAASPAKRAASPVKNFKTLPDVKVHNHVVLRQPKKSEMTYFGVNVTPKPSRKEVKIDNLIDEKPDLLQHYKPGKVKPRQKTPDPVVEKDYPIYENVSTSKTNRKTSPKREFDKGILEELTKAADQIMQAVNGYTDEERNIRSTDDELRSKDLDTIEETRRWKGQRAEKIDKSPKPKSKCNGSLTSGEGRIKRSLDRKSKVGLDKKHTSSSEAKSVSAVSAKASRRLQRASSREALLQSHGSSSEDLPRQIEIPVRKPRLVKKTKTTLTVSNGLEINKRSPVQKTATSTLTKPEERISLPEIRHKTAVSTIKSVAEKKRQRKVEESKRKQVLKKDVKAESSGKSDRGRSSSGGITQHRISTAYVPVCRHRSGYRKAAQGDDCPCLCS